MHNQLEINNVDSASEQSETKEEMLPQRQKKKTCYLDD